MSSIRHRRGSSFDAGELLIDTNHTDPPSDPSPPPGPSAQQHSSAAAPSASTTTSSIKATPRGSPSKTRQTSGKPIGSGSGGSILDDVQRMPQFTGLFSFLWSELTHGYALQNDPVRYAEKRRKVYAFIQIPRELEEFLCYGFLQCVDAFLYFFTLLPLRFLLALWRILLIPCLGASLPPSQRCDILKVIMLVVTVAALQFVDTSVMYHLVRGQAIIKLYIFYNMLEVADKLFSSFGQDILDALYWTATEPKSNRRYLPYLGTIPHLFGAICYVCLHTLLILCQATTLNVAFNSHNKALLTIMLSNNFVELKGSVFKKFGKPNLFQMACSDVRERFHYIILLAFVVIRNMTAVNWAHEHFLEMAPDLAMVIVGELMVDWVKHAFITKFNEIPFEVYRDFTTTLAYDVVKSKRTDAFSDHSDQVSRRMGFVPLPLSVLVVQIVLQTVKNWNKTDFMMLGVLYVFLILLKVLNSIVLLGRACRYVESYEAMQQHAKLLTRLRMKQKQSKSVPASPRLSLIEFSDVIGQNTDTRGGLTLTDLLTQLQQEQQNDITAHAHGHTPQPFGTRLSRSRSFAAKPTVPADEASELELALNEERPGGGTPFESTVNTPDAFNTSAASAIMQHQRQRPKMSTGISAVDVTSPILDEPDIDMEPAPESSQLLNDTDVSEVIVEEQSTGLTDDTAARQSPRKRVKMKSECESLQAVNRYTLQDRIEP